MARSSSSGDSLMRFLSATLLIGALGYGGGWVYTNFFSTNLLLQQKQQELVQVQAALKNVQSQAANQAMMIEQMGADLEASPRRREFRNGDWQGHHMWIRSRGLVGSVRRLHS